MRNLVTKLLVFAAISLPIAAHADTLDATLTGDSHTYTFTLPTPYSFPDQLHLVTLPTLQTTGTADGISGHTFDITFFTGIGTSGNSLIFDELGGTAFTLLGPPLVSPLPPTGAPPNQIDNAAIATGSFVLTEFSTQGLPIRFNLTIAPQAASSSTPEPSTLVLLATGTLGILCLARQRRRQVAQV
jgi:hypothetical protein